MLEGVESVIGCFSVFGWVLVSVFGCWWCFWMLVGVCECFWVLISVLGVIGCWRCW